MRLNFNRILDYFLIPFEIENQDNFWDNFCSIFKSIFNLISNFKMIIFFIETLKFKKKIDYFSTTYKICKKNNKINTRTHSRTYTHTYVCSFIVGWGYLPRKLILWSFCLFQKDSDLLPPEGLRLDSNFGKENFNTNLEMFLESMCVIDYLQVK